MDTPQAVTGFVVGLAVLTAAYTLGVARRSVSLLRRYGQTCVYNRNNWIPDPTLFFTGWLLLACSAIPYGEPLAPRKVESLIGLYRLLFLELV